MQSKYQFENNTGQKIRIEYDRAPGYDFLPVEIEAKGTSKIFTKNNPAPGFATSIATNEGASIIFNDSLRLYFHSDSCRQLGKPYQFELLSIVCKQSWEEIYRTDSEGLFQYTVEDTLYQMALIKENW